jgi:hypothetical protein
LRKFGSLGQSGKERSWIQISAFTIPAQLPPGLSGGLAHNHRAQEKDPHHASLIHQRRHEFGQPDVALAGKHFLPPRGKAVHGCLVANAVGMRFATAFGKHAGLAGMDSQAARQSQIFDMIADPREILKTDPAPGALFKELDELPQSRQHRLALRGKHCTSETRRLFLDARPTAHEPRLGQYFHNRRSIWQRTTFEMNRVFVF